MRRALISVTNKSGATQFAAGLIERGFEVVSTGGTARTLRDAGLKVTDVSEVTGFPEMLDGRIKTLHPKVHGGILADLRLPAHREAIASAGIEPFQVVCINLYAFEQAVSSEHALEGAIEAIDIGGPAMVRAAAKNFANVAVVTDPADYGRLLEFLDCGQPENLHGELAAKAFRHTAYYDSVIASYLTSRFVNSRWTETVSLGAKWDGQPLRYGENPHQSGARYIDPATGGYALRSLDMGKEISYNNWLDADAAWRLAMDLPRGACAIIKHGNPCGAAVGADLGESYRLAKAADPISAFGGVAAFNGKLNQSAVDAMTEKGNFLEVLIATDFDEDAKAAFLGGSPWTRNTRFLVGPQSLPERETSVRTILGGYLLQDCDRRQEVELKAVTKRQPSDSEMAALEFVWRLVPHVKSNAIVVGTSNRLLGTGAGQMNRVQSVRLALDQAGELAKGAVLASDAFFPFPDSVETAAKAGISAIVQPGGSKKDDAVIEAANELGICMVFTNTRHFRH